jgi:glycerol-3-phosphate acyltransferase PlsY
MNDLLINIICFVAAFLAGSIPWGLVVGRLFGVDPRTVGSGNIGATNVARALGPLGFVAVYLLDAASGFLPVFLLAPVATVLSPTGNGVLLGIVLIVGHVFTPWLGFKGGKGVATASGVTVALVPWGFVAALACFLVILLMTRIVSISSLAASVALPLFVIYFTGIKGWTPDDYWILGYSLLITVVVFITHRKNMGRLFKGTEARVGAPKKDGA